MSDIIEELRRGAEMEEEYDADGIIRIGYKRSLRYRAADKIERLRALVLTLISALEADGHDGGDAETCGGCAIVLRVREALGEKAE